MPIGCCRERRARTPDPNLPPPCGERLIDGRGAVQERATVVITGSTIPDVGPAQREPPPGAIDLTGRTMLPGLVDAHVHLSSHMERSPDFGPREVLKGEPPRPRELGYFILSKAARALLDAGITTVRDVGSYDDEALALREANRLGLVGGPRVLSCG